MDEVPSSDGGGKAVAFVVGFAEAWVGVLFHGHIGGSFWIK
jgi:hypothetical protein